ncbi:hypothetical protein ACFE04_017445 [Oxalis oulophora]
MPNTKSSSTSTKNRRGKLLSQKSSSFHGGILPKAVMSDGLLRRPKTLPDLFPGGRDISVEGRSLTTTTPEAKPKLTKLLLNVTIQGSVGPVHVVMSPECTVIDLVAAAVKQYAKEGRRPMLTTTDPARFDLHYSQFSLESLVRDEKLIKLGSRNFFLCLRKEETESKTVSNLSCSKEAEKVSKTGIPPWLKFMDFLL